MVKSIKDIKRVPAVPMIQESTITSPVNVLKPLSIQAKMQRKRKKATGAGTSLVTDMQQRLKTIVKSDNLTTRTQQKWKTIAETAPNKPDEAIAWPVQTYNVKAAQLARKSKESELENATEGREYPKKGELHKKQAEQHDHIRPIKTETVDDYLESIQKLQSALDSSATSQFSNEECLSDVEDDIKRARMCESSQLPIILNSTQIDSSTEITDESSSNPSKRMRL